MSWIPEPAPIDNAPAAAPKNRRSPAKAMPAAPIASWAPVRESRHIQAHLETWRKPRESGRRSVMHENMTVRISHLGSLCPRRGFLEANLEKLGSTSGIESLTADEAYLYHGGHAVHEFIQDEILGPTGMLWGLWTCKACKAVHTHETFETQDGIGFTVPQPMPAYDETCMECGHAAGWKYKELTLWDKGLGIDGHTDGVLRDFVGGPFYGFELKTIGDNSWKMVKHGGRPGAPFPEAVDQAQTYASILSHGMKIDGTRLLYVKRGATTLLDNMAEYVLPVASHRSRWAGELMRYRAGIASPTLPPRFDECRDAKTSFKAKFCKCAGPCFENEDGRLLPEVLRAAQERAQDSHEEAAGDRSGI